MRWRWWRGGGDHVVVTVAAVVVVVLAPLDIVLDVELMDPFLADRALELPLLVLRRVRPLVVDSRASVVPGTRSIFVDHRHHFAVVNVLQRDGARQRRTIVGPATIDVDLAGGIADRSECKEGKHLAEALEHHGEA